MSRSERRQTGLAGVIVWGSVCVLSACACPASRPGSNRESTPTSATSGGLSGAGKEQQKQPSSPAEKSRADALGRALALWPEAPSRVPKSGEGSPAPLSGRVWYVRPGGGDPSQCSGRADADQPAQGKACALNHPFHLLPPGGEPRIAGGDTVVIAAGDYPMGHGAPGSDRCSRHYPWDCYMPPVPSGPDPKHPTRILGQGWDAGCPKPPRLLGQERANRLINLEGSSNVELACLELSDRSGCVTHHPEARVRCQRDTPPFGPWAGHGLVARDSRNVVLRQLNIHGLAHGGVLAGRLADWTLEEVRIAGNGWVGWDGDLNQGESGNSGTLRFHRVTIAWNGCAETFPGGEPTACWGQSAGGYGDGLGTATTGGDWVFEDCRVLNNTSDGLDLLYHSAGGTVTVRRLYAAGNAGNALKVTGNARVEASVLAGNCAFFADRPFAHEVDHCRALGNTLEVAFTEGAKVEVVNNTFFGEGDVLLSVGTRSGHRCSGGETLVVKNNVMVGAREHHSPGDRAAAYYRAPGSCDDLRLQAGNNLVFGVKGDCALGRDSRCADPGLAWLGEGAGLLFDPWPAGGAARLGGGAALARPVDRDLLGYRPAQKGRRLLGALWQAPARGGSR